MRTVRLFSWRIKSRIILASLIGSFMIASTVLGPAHAYAAFQEEEKELPAEQLSERQWKLGYHGFNIVSNGVGLEHDTDVTKWKRRPASETVLVVLGGISNPPTNLERYYNNGGAVFVASDQDSHATLVPMGIIISPVSTSAMASEYRGVIVDPDSSIFFGGHRECPIVSRLIDSHPVFNRANEVIGNRVAKLNIFGKNKAKAIAFLPRKKRGRTEALICVNENENGGRLVCMGDQSVLSNQMLMHGDNAVFAQDAMLWLSGFKETSKARKHVLVWDGNKALQTVDIAGVDVELPPPTSKEVWEAPKSLPPSAWFDFGNSVIAKVEDEDMVNDLVHRVMDNQSDKKIDRFWILVSFGLISLFALTTYVWQKKLLRFTASDVAAKRSAAADKVRKNNEAFERQMAVEVLLDTFCVEVANRRYYDCPAFPNELVAVGVYGKENEINRMFNSMKKVNQLYNTKASKYWTRQRLLDLESEIEKWKSFFPADQFDSQPAKT